MPPPLVRMARRLPGNGFWRPSVSAAAKSLVEIEHAQQARAAERSIVDGIGAGERARVGRGGRAPCAWRPDLITTTGFTRAAARAADMNLRASLMASM